MSSNEYLTDEHGLHTCDMCGFSTVHEKFIKQHMVKSHGHEEYPEPPVLMEKWLKLEQQENKGAKKSGRGGK